jgi:methanogenic corrinoid protein MtbC1
MSLPKQSSQTASEWLDENLDALAIEITDRHFSLHPELEVKYGRQGRSKCREDALYHLHYLSEAVASSAKVFTDYAAWTKVMLAARGIEWRELAENFEQMLHVLTSRAPRDDHATFERTIRPAIDALPNMPERLPRFIDSSAPFADLANFYLDALLRLDREAAINKVLKEISSGLTVGNLFNHVIYPVQQEVGRLWQGNEITVLQEHYCTAATELLVARVRSRLVAGTRDVRALALCPEEEQHCLAMRMFADLLETDGWKVTYIGTNVPTNDVLKYVKTNAPDLLALSAATPLSLKKARELIAAIRRISPKNTPWILVGGSALNSDPNLWKTLGADAFSPDLPSGVDAANRLVSQSQ